MIPNRPTFEQPVRLAELLASLSLALDLGLGQPMEHLLRSCLLAMRFGRALDLPEHELVDVYWLAFLRFLAARPRPRSPLPSSATMSMPIAGSSASIRGARWTCSRLW